MQGLRNHEKRDVHSGTPQRRGMSVTEPFGYAQGREPVERQMVFDGESGKGKQESWPHWFWQIPHAPREMFCMRLFGLESIADGVLFEGVLLGRQREG